MLFFSISSCNKDEMLLFLFKYLFVGRAKRNPSTADAVPPLTRKAVNCSDPRRKGEIDYD